MSLKMRTKNLAGTWLNKSNFLFQHMTNLWQSLWRRMLRKKFRLRRCSHSVNCATSFYVSQSPVRRISCPSVWTKQAKRKRNLQKWQSGMVLQRSTLAILKPERWSHDYLTWSVSRKIATALKQNSSQQAKIHPHGYSCAGSTKWQLCWTGLSHQWLLINLKLFRASTPMPCTTPLKLSRAISSSVYLTPRCRPHQCLKKFNSTLILNLLTCMRGLRRLTVLFIQSIGFYTG